MGQWRNGSATVSKAAGCGFESYLARLTDSIRIRILSVSPENRPARVRRGGAEHWKLKSGRKWGG